MEKNTRKATPSSSVMTSKASTAHNTTCLKSPAVSEIVTVQNLIRSTQVCYAVMFTDRQIDGFEIPTTL